jgi:hypothetical protein
MTKVVYVNGFKEKASANAHKGVVKKRVRDSSGEIVRVSSVDARSETFGEDLRYIFGRNVAEARRENIVATGKADGVVKKR